MKEKRDIKVYIYISFKAKWRRSKNENWERTQRFGERFV